MFPDNQKEWLKEGCRRLYLVARAYQPDLVRVGGKLAGYEEFAEVFGEFNGHEPTRKDRDRARSRWSARAQNVLRIPIQQAGARVPALFGKSSSVRGKYQQAARGNQNRRKNANEHATTPAPRRPEPNP